MSQWLDMQAQNSVGATSTIDTSGVSLPSIFDSTAKAVSGAAASATSAVKKDNLMLYLTAAGVILSAMVVFGKVR